MRIVVLGGDCAGLKYHIGLDEFQAADDFVILNQGITIHVDETSLQYLWGSHVDWVEVEGDAGYVIFNPNKGRSKGGCGKDGEGCMTKGDGKTCLKNSGGCSEGCGSSCGSRVQDTVQISL